MEDFTTLAYVQQKDKIYHGNINSRPRIYADQSGSYWMVIGDHWWYIDLVEYMKKTEKFVSIQKIFIKKSNVFDRMIASSLIEKNKMENAYNFMTAVIELKSPKFKYLTT